MSARARMDWDVLRRRLAAAQSAIERSLARDPGETKRVLDARARALGRVPPQEGGQDGVEVVQFRLSGEIYAVEASRVREIGPLENFAPLVCAPAFVLGIVNLRGEILSVVDIRRFFDLPQQGLSDLNKLVVLRSETMTFGILADAVLGMRRIAPAGLQPSLPTLSGVREKYLMGVTADRTVVLDAMKLLEDEQLVVREQVQR